MKTIILTGSNSGLGKDLRKLLNAERFSGDKKIFFSRQSINDDYLSPESEYISEDLSKPIESVSDISFNKSTKSVIFINNAATIKPITQIVNIDFNAIEEAMQINFWNPLKIATHLTNEAKKLNINIIVINITSGAAKKPVNGWLAYCVSKSSIRMALDILEDESHNLRLYHFDPGVMDTKMQESIRQSDKTSMNDVELFRDLYSDGKLRDPKDVALEIVELIDKE